MNKIILDTDIGDDIDDALALAYAVLNPEIELVGVTTVFKNTEKRAALACCVLEALNETTIPVYVGIGKTVPQSIPDWERIAAEHQPRQMEILTRRQPSLQPCSTRAVDFIIDTIMSGNGDITLVPVGPLTNIAAALLVEPRLIQKTRICLMGGAIDRITPEWNVLCDPEAARIVFGSGAKITMVGLDVTTKCKMTYDQVKAIGAVQRPINEICFELIHLWGGDKPEPCPTLHAPLAFAFVVDSPLCELMDLRLSGAASADHVQGLTVPIDGHPNTSVCVDVDSERFMGNFLGTLTHSSIRG